MFTHDSIDRYIASIKARGLADETIRGYEADLRSARADIPDADTVVASWSWDDVAAACGAHLNAHRGTWSSRTINRHLAALRQWARFAGNPDFMSNFKAPRPPRAMPHPIPEGIKGVLAMIDSTRNPHHKALCALTGLAGLRIGEAIAVTINDFDLNEMTLTVHGKGAKQRIVPISMTAWDAIKGAYEKSIELNRLLLIPLTNRGARYAVKRHARNAGIATDISSHDMRATFATAAYQVGHDLRAVQELLGHASPDTTQIYTGVTMQSMRTAAEVA